MHGVRRQIFLDVTVTANGGDSGGGVSTGGSGGFSGFPSYGSGGGSTSLPASTDDVVVTGSQRTNSCSRSVNGTPSPADAARTTRQAVLARGLLGTLVGSGAGPLGSLAGAIVGYGSVAVERAYQLYPGQSWDPRNGPAGNRLYGAVTTALGIPRNLALRASGAIEQYGRDSNAPYDPSNGSFLNRSGRLGNSTAAIRDIDEGAACAR